MPAILFRLKCFNSLPVKAKTNPWTRALFVKHFSTDSWQTVFRTIVILSDSKLTAIDFH